MEWAYPGEVWRRTNRAVSLTNIYKTSNLKKKKMKMNNLTFRGFSVSKCGGAFSYVGGIVG